MHNNKTRNGALSPNPMKLIIIFFCATDDTLDKPMEPPLRKNRLILQSIGPPETPRAESILEGTRDNADLDKLMQYKTTPDTVIGYVEVKEFLVKFKSWNEKTSTSPLRSPLGPL
jgi:hypothetical protein